MKDVKSTIAADNTDRFATGSVQVTGYEGLIGVEAEGTISVLDYEQLIGVAAEADIVVTDWEALADVSITVGEDTIVEGIDFTAETSNNATATNIAAAIDALDDVASTASTATVTVTAAVKGRDGNLIGLSTDAAAGLTIVEAHLLGGKDSAVVTVGEEELVEGTDFTAETNNNTTATNLAAAIDALGDYAASAAGPLVTITAAVIGDAWNVTVSATWDEDDVIESPFTIVSLAGGLDEGVLTFNGAAITQGTDFDAETSDAVTATNLAAEIDGISGFSAEVDGEDDTLILITADSAGEDGNVTMSTNSSVLDLVQMSGGADYFYSDTLNHDKEGNSAVTADIEITDLEATEFASGTLSVQDYTGLTGDTITFNGTVLTEGVDWTAATSNEVTAESIKDAIHALDGFSATREGVVVTITADDAGADGNVGIASSAGADIVLSGATLTGGKDLAIQVFVQTSYDKDEWINVGAFSLALAVGKSSQITVTDVRGFTRIAFSVQNGTISVEATLATSEFGGDRINTFKSRLVSAESYLDVVSLSGFKFKEARITNGATAQYIQVWDAAGESDIAANGELKECIWAEANQSFALSPSDPSEKYELGIVVAGSSNASALAYTAGADLAFVVAEFFAG